MWFVNDHIAVFYVVDLFVPVDVNTDINTFSQNGTTAMNKAL